MSKKIKVNFLVNEKRITVEYEIGLSLLEVARTNNIPLPARCEGNGICGSCHVIFEKEVYDLMDVSEEEDDVLEKLPNRTPTSRLACQVYLDESMDNINIIINGKENEK